jgi:hypothetical protein
MFRNRDVGSVHIGGKHEMGRKQFPALNIRDIGTIRGE